MNTAQKYPMVELITYIVGLFDPYGIDHSERTANLSVKLGERYGMTDTQLDELELAGLLHDIGKMGIPESIRSKAGQLTEAEFFLMQQHPEIGWKIMQRMNGNITKSVRLAIYHHHENYDGSGYPAKLKGEAIPLEARIIRIADTFDAITHSRGIRTPLEPARAMAVMERDQEGGPLFDPSLFALFLEMMRS
jgi:putative nucleotidyltransferase with HDIG domain